MPRLQTFLTALTLLPSMSMAVAPVQAPPNGKAHGFISNLENIYPPPTGDWLTSTMCYCRAPTPAKEIYQFEKAHIFQHEYYNYHSNATFVVDHLCLSRAQAEGDHCERPNIGGDNNDWLLETPYEYICKTFARTEEEKVQQGNSKRQEEVQQGISKRQGHEPVVCSEDCDPGPYSNDLPEPTSHREHDKVCFAVGKNYYGLGSKMDVKFNDQHRTMRKNGDQGRVETGAQDVQGYCEDMCQTTFGMPADMKLKDKRADGGSRQYVYTAVDDMCDHCKK